MGQRERETTIMEEEWWTEREKWRIGWGREKALLSASFPFSERRPSLYKTFFSSLRAPINFAGYGWPAVQSFLLPRHLQWRNFCTEFTPSDSFFALLRAYRYLHCKRWDHLWGFCLVIVMFHASVSEMCQNWLARNSNRLTLFQL